MRETLRSGENAAAMRPDMPASRDARNIERPVRLRPQGKLRLDPPFLLCTRSPISFSFAAAMAAHAPAPATRSVRRPWYRPSLTTQIMIGLVVGGVIGYVRPDWGNSVYFLRDIFLNLIKSIIGPLVFSTLVVGIAGSGDLKKVGRMGLKALIYFEVATTVALFIGLTVVNITKPGVGVVLTPSSTDVVQKIAQTHPKTLVETLVYAFPSSVVESLARGDILQVVAFAVLFGMAVSAVGEKGKPILRAMESLSQVMFKFTNYVMMFAPIGVGAAMAHTIGTQGLGVLVNLGNLILTLYLGLTIFVVVVFGLVLVITRVPIRKFVKAVREPAAIAFRYDEQRIGHAESDAGHGTNRRAQTHCRVCHADWILLQPRWLDASSRDRFRLRRASGRSDHGPAHGNRSADHDDAGVDGHVQRRCRRPALIRRGPSRNAQHLPSGRSRSR